MKGIKMSKTLTASEICPMDLGINILSGKWKLKILWNIQRKNIIRFNELQKLLGSITTKTLTNQLRELEEQKIIKRNVYQKTTYDRTAERKSASAGRRECEETKLVSDPWYAAFGAADCDFLFWK